MFYKFLQNYHQQDRFLNVRIPNPELKDEIIGILDRQQSLSAIYLALQGTYSVRRPYFGWNYENAFPSQNAFIPFTYYSMKGGISVH